MGDSGGVVAKLGNMKALLGLVAGAGASYGIYKFITRGEFRRTKKGFKGDHQSSEVAIQPGSLVSKLSGLEVIRTRGDDAQPGGVAPGEAGNLGPRHLKALLSSLQTSGNPDDRCQVLLTLGNAAAFTVNQDLVREFGGLHVIACFLSDPVLGVRVHTLNALNNLSMNIKNQDQLKVYIPQVLELIEISPVNSDLQLAALRLLTNLSVTDKYQHLLKESITLLLSLLIVSNESLQIQSLKILVNLSSNPDMMDDIVQAQVPASVVLLFDVRTALAVLQRLLTFVWNLKAWRPSAQVAADLRTRQDCLFRVLLDDSPQLHSRLVQLLSHPDGEIQAQAARIFT